MTVALMQSYFRERCWVMGGRSFLVKFFCEVHFACASHCFRKFELSFISQHGRGLEYSVLLRCLFLTSRQGFLVWGFVLTCNSVLVWEMPLLFFSFTTMCVVHGASATSNWWPVIGMRYRMSSWSEGFCLEYLLAKDTYSSWNAF